MSVRVQCPECGTQLQASDDRIGRNATCPRCRTKFPVEAPVENDFDEENEEESSGGGSLLPPKNDHENYEDLVDMTAMVDIVFFLLIFFMITSASGMLSCIDMPPPKQEGAAAAKRPADFDADTDSITVRIDENNRLFIEELEFPTEADLHDRLKNARGALTKKLLVKGHGNAHHGTLVMVLDMGSVLGFEPISLSVAKEEESP